MKIFIASDLHFEFHHESWLPPLPSKNECDMIVLAGDIAVGNGTTLAIERIFKATETPIVWIGGNHEYYSCNIGIQACNFRRDFSHSNNIHFLERDNVTIDGVVFLGTTLWTGFDIHGADNISKGMEAAENSVADFNYITTDTGRKFKPSDALELYQKNRQWLSQSLEKYKDRKTVVITHFPPARCLRHQAIPEDILSTYFQAECQSLIEKYEPDVWIYGHNHWSNDQIIGNTHIVSNQFGYPNEQSIPQYEIKIIEI